MERAETLRRIHSATRVDIREDSSFADQGFDSLDLVEATMEVEDEFGIGISDSDLEQITDIHTLATVVEGKLNQNQRLADAQSGKRIKKWL